MARATQNLPRTFREPRKTPARNRALQKQKKKRYARAVTAAVVVAVALSALFLIIASRDSIHASAERADRAASALLAGIPQRERTLGSPTAPVTLEIFLDLKDPDSRAWFIKDLPQIIRDYVRTGTLRLEYRAYKTNTFSPQGFVKDQTAALAAGAQDKLWNFIYTFYIHQGSEFASYATEGFLENIAGLVPGLNLARWHGDRHRGHREEQTTTEDQTARALGLHVTPSFRIGKAGSALHNYAGHSIVKYGEQHPIALPEASDIGQVIQELLGSQR
jgi:protein-disulfide isomerase